MDYACAPVFDTQVAAGILGHVSAGELRRSGSVANVKFTKVESLTDWSKRL